MGSHLLNGMQDTQSLAEKRMFEWAFAASKMGVWRYDLANHGWLLSDQAMQVFGFTDAALMKRESLMSRLSKVDRLRVETAWNMLIHDAQPFNIEYEISDLNIAEIRMNFC